MVGNESIEKSCVPVDLVVELEEKRSSTRWHQIEITQFHIVATTTQHTHAFRYERLDSTQSERETTKRVNVSLSFFLFLHGVVNRTAVPRPDLQPGKRMRPAVLLLLLTSCHNTSRWDWWPARCFRRFIEQRSR